MELSIRDLELRHRRLRVSRPLTFDADTGLRLILGPNGVGKTTLLEQLGTLPEASRSSILIDGAPASRGHLRQIGYLAQDDPLIPAFRVREYIEYCGWLKGMASPDAASSASALLQAFALQPYERQRISKLSGGTRQRVGLAGSVVHGPDIWLLDEPMVGLDPEQRAFFADLIAGTGQKTILMSTHLFDIFASLDPRCTVLKRSDGDRASIIYDGPSSYLATLGAGSLETGYLRLLEMHS